VIPDIKPMNKYQKFQYFIKTISEINEVSISSFIITNKTFFANILTRLYLIHLIRDMSLELKFVKRRFSIY